MVVVVQVIGWRRLVMVLVPTSPLRMIVGVAEARTCSVIVAIGAVTVCVTVCVTVEMLWAAVRARPMPAKLVPVEDGILTGLKMGR
jgi:hypothetical protein